ncbi:MAG: hypothetical protein WCP34_11840 [Pseudomonadota bacterium]
MATQIENSSIPTIRAALELQNGDDLKSLLSLLPVGKKPTRKAELVAAIEEHLAGEKLHSLWERLDGTQRLAVAETMYSALGIFDAGRFRAKYGVSPVFSTKNEKSYGESPSPLRLFIYRGDRYGGGGLTVPEDLAERLRQFVPKPASASLASVAEVPETFERVDKTYQWEESDQGLTRKKSKVSLTTHQIPLIRRDTERDALAELVIVLRLVDLGKLAVSDKTSLPGAVTLRELAGVLAGGDFYPPEARKSEGSEAIGSIKAFAWLLLIQAGGLAELHGKKLALTKAGRNALGKPAETLRGIWQRWLKTKLFDEFNRVDAIKGQQGKGKRTMIAPVSRRAVVNEAMRECPVDRWVEFDVFSRYMQAAGHTFEVTRQPWDLYIGEANYGSLGHSGFHGWSILQKRYLSCLLFEYAATLGMIDVAYVEPWQVPCDYSDLWGTDDMSFLSRYDGLCWFRLNLLGAYCLGESDDYQPSRLEAKGVLAILPSLQIRVASGVLSTEETLFLETWTEREGDDLWRLDRAKILNAVENGRRVDELRDFLEARDPQGLPDIVEGFLSTTGRQASALKNIGTVLYIECADAGIAELIAKHEQTSALCRLAGSKQLVVKVEFEERFRKAVNGLGYGMPKV